MTEAEGLEEIRSGWIQDMLNNVGRQCPPIEGGGPCPGLLQVGVTVEGRDRDREEYLRVFLHEALGFINVISAGAEMNLRRISRSKDATTEELQTLLEVLARGFKSNFGRAVALEHLLRDAFTLDEIERGKMSLDWQSFSLRSLLSSTVGDVSAVYENGHAFKAAIPRSLPEVVGDPSRTSGVVYGLLTNAVKYSPGGGTIRVVAAEEGNQFVRVDIQDEGLGIPKGEELRIFEPYYRIEHQGTKGSGLGLAIALRTIEAQGGKIWAESEGPGKGSTFKFTLLRAAVPIQYPETDKPEG